MCEEHVFNLFSLIMVEKFYDIQKKLRNFRRNVRVVGSCSGVFLSPLNAFYDQSGDSHFMCIGKKENIIQSCKVIYI